VDGDAGGRLRRSRYLRHSRYLQILEGLMCGAGRRLWGRSVGRLREDARLCICWLFVLGCCWLLRAIPSHSELLLAVRGAARTRFRFRALFPALSVIVLDLRKNLQPPDRGRGTRATDGERVLGALRGPVLRDTDSG
jgi:hypothetical protein